MLASADVLLESFRPGVMGGFGLAYEDLQERHPALVYVSSSGYPPDGPTPNRPGHDLNYLAGAGAIQPRQEDHPSLLATPVGDLATGLVVALATTAAVMHSRHTGQGQHVSTNMADLSLVLAAVGAGRLPARENETNDRNERPRTWPDVPLGNFPCYGLYETADGRYVSLGNIEGKFWEEFLAITGLTALAGSQFATGTAADEAKAAIAKVIRSRTLSDWEVAFAERDVCFAPVRTLREAVGDPANVSRGIVSIEADDLLVAAFPARFSATPPLVGGVAPEVGAHNSQFFSA
jgi:crotonobetainyl-CoA:carnitine CoA-transferase CaiB-like acyl-CoA transferase